MCADVQNKWIEEKIFKSSNKKKTIFFLKIILQIKVGLWQIETTGQSFNDSPFVVDSLNLIFYFIMSGNQFRK